MSGLKILSLDELAEGILEGKRNFSGRRLDPENTDLSGHPLYRQVQKYLMKETDVNRRLQKNPLTLDGSDFSSLIAVELYAPHTFIGEIFRVQASKTLTLLVYILAMQNLQVPILSVRKPVAFT